MASYKTLYQEALEEVQRLRTLIAGSPDEHLRELERTREIVDLAGIARHMHVERFTPQQWRQREHMLTPGSTERQPFPPVDFPEIKEPLWYASTIRDSFARPTRRLWCDNPTSLDAAGCAMNHPLYVVA